MPLPGSSTAFVCLRVPRRGRGIGVSRVCGSWHRCGGREWRSRGGGARARHTTQLPTERGVLYFYRRTRQSPRRAPQAPRDVSERLAQSTHGECAAAAAYVSRVLFDAGVGVCTLRATGAAVRAPPSRRIAPMVSSRISRTSLHPSATCRARWSSKFRINEAIIRGCFAACRGDVAPDGGGRSGSSSSRGWTPTAGRAASPTGAAQSADTDMNRFRSTGPLVFAPWLFDNSSLAL